MNVLRTQIPRGVVLLVLCLLASFANAQRNLDPTRFEDTILAFEAQDKTSRPAEGAILLTGSSSIARWNDQAEAALAPLSVIPRGFGGSVMADVLHYLDRVAWPISRARFSSMRATMILLTIYLKRQ